MSLFTEGGAGELRELFFESAAELLLALSDQGLQLERDPRDAEIVREVRRSVHTLKGDSAACGYTKLSGLAHELEDVLTPEIAAVNGARLAELVLQASDTFSTMLDEYRTGGEGPTGDELRAQIRQLVTAAKPDDVVPYKLQGRFAWSEYELLAAEQAGLKENVFNIALAVDPHCPLPAAALQMARSVLQQGGTIIAMQPDSATNLSTLDVIEACVSSAQKAAWFSHRCLIPSMISNVLVEEFVVEGASLPLEIPEDVVVPAPDEKLVFAVPEADPEPVRGETPSAEPAEYTQVAVQVAASQSPQEKRIAAITESLLRVDAERIDDVLNLVGELIIGKSMLMQGVGEFDKRFPKDPLRARFSDAMAFQARVLTDLQKSVMKIRMVPIDQLFRRFPRVVRDTAKACGKEVEFAVHGEETDLDKSILDLLHEPLSHLIRNAVDHGIEPPLERIAKGKSSRGTVRLDAYHQGNQIVIEVADDGSGIDRAKLLSKAIERNVVTLEESAHLSDAEVNGLVFHPGLSTAEQVTSISGRGVGMDVVKTVLDRLKGGISIESRPGAGTTFYLKVPLTLAIIKALMFRVSDRLYAVPLNSVVEITRAHESEVHRVDQHEVLQLRENVLPLVRLARLEKLRATKSSKFFVVVVTIQDRRFGLVVDRLVGEEELVIKPLDDSLVATDIVSGASILGDGTVVLILNTNAVVTRFIKNDAKGAHA